MILQVRALFFLRSAKGKGGPSPFYVGCKSALTRGNHLCHHQVIIHFPYPVERTNNFHVNQGIKEHFHVDQGIKEHENFIFSGHSQNFTLISHHLIKIFMNKFSFFTYCCLISNIKKIQFARNHRVKVLNA
jgi:hypothetical protein